MICKILVVIQRDPSPIPTFKGKQGGVSVVYVVLCHRLKKVSRESSFSYSLGQGCLVMAAVLNALLTHLCYMFAL